MAPASSDPSTAPPGTRRFASPRLIRFLATVCLLIGGGAMIGGVAYAINGATQAQADVVVPVKARYGAVLEVRDPSLGGSGVAIRVGGTPDRGTVRLDLPGAPAGTRLEANTEALSLRAWDSTVAEQLLGRAGIAVLGICAGLGSLLLRRLLLSIADGRPFEAGNAARIAGIAGLVVVGSLASHLLPAVATNLVLERVGLGGADSPVQSTSTLPVGPLLVAALLLALAEAFRGGTELAQDVEGLV